MQVFRMLLLWINWFFFWYTTLLLRTGKQRSVVFWKTSQNQYQTAAGVSGSMFITPHATNIKTSKITFIWILHPALTTKQFKGCPWIIIGPLHYIGNESAPCFHADAANWSHFSKPAVWMERNTKTWSERQNEGAREKFQSRVWGASGGHAETL